MIKLAELLGEKATFTSKYNDSPKLKGGQKDLPDEVQAKIVAKEGYDEFDMEDEGPDYNSVSDLEDELRRLVRWSNQYGSKGADSKIEQLKKRIEDLKKSPVKEGDDHEVAMAQSSLKSIIKSAIELHAKLGNMERDIPGWIQDHITNAENYIDQAAQGFHELKHDVVNEKRMQKLAGIKESKVNNSYVVKDDELSDADGDFYTIDKQKALEYLSQFNSEDINAEQFIDDDEGWGEYEQYIDNVEQMTDKELEDNMRQGMSYYYFSNSDSI